LIQGERRTSNIDSKIHLLGFDYFKIQFHSFFLDTFSTVSVKVQHRGLSELSPLLPPTPAIGEPDCHVSVVPIADLPGSIGARTESW
jgi:hypothetical protein